MGDLLDRVKEKMKDQPVTVDGVRRAIRQGIDEQYEEDMARWERLQRILRALKEPRP